jgi:hypothetical protein
MKTFNTAKTMKIGGFYNWVYQPERLVYLGLNESQRWHQFAKIESPTKVWCEVLESDLHSIENTTSVTHDLCVVEEANEVTRPRPLQSALMALAAVSAISLTPTSRVNNAYSQRLEMQHAAQRKALDKKTRIREEIRARRALSKAASK